MTANINVQNKPVMPDQLKPVLKAVADQSKDIKNDPISLQSVKSSKVGETENAKENSKEALDNAVEQLNTYVQSVDRSLEFNIDKDSGEIVVKVIDTETDELIRQIPTEQALYIAKHLDTGAVDSADAGIFLIKERA